MNITKFTALTSAIVISGLVQAQVVSYTSFVGGSGYDQVAQGIAIVGPSNVNHIYMGYQFTAGVGGTLTSVRVPTLYRSGNTQVSLGLYSNLAGDLLGGQMATWQFTDAGGQHITTLSNNDPSISLVTGTKYWLVMGAQGDGVHFWGKSQIGGLMYQLFSDDGGVTTHYGNNDVFPAYEVNVNPVPEPMSFVVLGLGAAILRRRRK